MWIKERIKEITEYTNTKAATVLSLINKLNVFKHPQFKVYTSTHTYPFMNLLELIQFISVKWFESFNQHDNEKCVRDGNILCVLVVCIFTEKIFPH